jgi:hypothetical protein
MNEREETRGERREIGRKAEEDGKEEEEGRRVRLSSIYRKEEKLYGTWT